MQKKLAQSLTYGPQLVFEEKPFECGYAPRALHVSVLHKNTVFVGCKDGSVSVVTSERSLASQTAAAPGLGDFTTRPLSAARIPGEEGIYRGAVYALCEWDREHLLVARRGSGLSLLRWSLGGEGAGEERLAEEVPLARDEEERLAGEDSGRSRKGPIRCILRLDAHRIAVAYRDSGLVVITQGSGSAGPFDLEEVPDSPKAIRTILPLYRQGDVEKTANWFLLTDRGDFFRWDGDSASAPKEHEDFWPGGRRPSLIADSCLLVGEEERKNAYSAAEFLLATDRALYRFWARTKEKPQEPADDWGLEHERIALAGLNATPMALSYTYAGPGAHEYLWITDLRGDSHLFWGSGPDPSIPGRNFLRSGVLHPRSETVLSALLPQTSREGESFFVVQVRRDDRVVLGHYWTADPLPASSAEAKQDRSLRKLLYLGRYKNESGNHSGPDAVRQYLSDRNASIDNEGWWDDDAAVVAELFEYLAEDEARRRILLESLRAPYSETVQQILKATRSPEASRLWAFTLLGVIHRAPDDQSSSYLGLLRWLRHRQVELLPDSDYEDLVKNIDVHLLFARKWGLRGEVNRHREDLVEPQKSLAGQETALKLRQPTAPVSDEIRRLRLERLTYLAELFSRCVNLILEDERGRRLRGRTAWATAVLPLSPDSHKALVAVSWMWGGVELLELEADGEKRPRLRSLYSEGKPGAAPAGNPHVLSKKRPEPSEIAQEKYGYSRVVHLGRVKDRLYLLSAPASEPRDDAQAILLVWPLGFGSEWRETIPPEIKVLAGVGAESIYSLLELGEGRLVAGLSGVNSQPSLALIRIRSSGAGFTVDPPSVRPVSVGAASPAADAEDDPAAPRRRRNRVWALARLPCEKPGRFRVALGCDSGDIFETEISWPEEENSDQVPTIDDSTVRLIGRMRSPVQVLACSFERDGATRVFAGGEDGAIVAWQELREEEPEELREEKPERNAPRFGTLWATTEQSPISDIHLIESREEESSRSLVLVVTREGRYVVFDNRKEISRSSEEDSLQDHPTRVPLPGSRHGRRSLGCAAFASGLIEWKEDFQIYSKEARELGAFAALLIATGEGQLRVVSLHSPEYTEIRKQQHKNVVALWQSVLSNPVHLRLTEAIYKASPALSLTLVRFLLGHDRSDGKTPPGGGWSASKTFKELEKFPWCLPRHLRPLLRLRMEWDNLRSGVTKRRDAEILEKPLSAALERSWRLNDPGLFKEICQVALRRANEDLYSAGRMDSNGRLGRGEELSSREWGKEAAHFAFHEVLRAIELALPRWLGSDRRQEARVRIAVAKHLVDGDTFWVLQREAARELSDPSLRERSHEAFRPFGAVASTRIRAIRELVNKRHPLVSLESLRAANMSMARLCRRLVEARERVSGLLVGYHPPDSDSRDDCEVRWEKVFQPYFEDLTAAAARTFRTPLELNDALAHEYSRTFALCICACPSATLRMAARLSEQQLVSDPEPEQGLSHRVLVQLRILRSIGLDVPGWADGLFRLGTQPPRSGWNPANEEGLEVLWTEGVFFEQEGVRRLQSVSRLGKVNRSDLEALENLWKLLHSLDSLSDRLETTAEGIDLSEGWRKQLADLLERLPEGYGDSRAFWEEALKDLKSLELPEPTGASLRKIRPQTVLLCQPLADWAQRSLARIEAFAGQGRLVQPEVTTFSRVLRRLSLVARAFPTSAAVQANVVQGILEHHLLEDLDEHVLELEEMAEVLNPRSVWDFRDEGRRRPSLPPGTEQRATTAERFSSYLLGRAHSAESIPKNLRNLQALLRTAKSGEIRQSLAQLLSSFWREGDELAWKRNGGDALSPPLKDAQETRYLTLVLAELDQNHRRHACKPWIRPTESLRPEFRFVGDRGLEIEFFFAVESGDAKDKDSNLARLRDLEGLELQQPTDPIQSREVASSGTGLYLASLAAAIVEWRLDLSGVKGPPDGQAGVGRFLIKLAPKVEFKSAAEQREGPP